MFGEFLKSALFEGSPDQKRDAISVIFERINTIAAGTATAGQALKQTELDANNFDRRIADVVVGANPLVSSMIDTSLNPQEAQNQETVTSMMYGNELGLGKPEDSQELIASFDKMAAETPEDIIRNTQIEERQAQIDRINNELHRIYSGEILPAQQDMSVHLQNMQAGNDQFATAA